MLTIQSRQPEQTQDKPEFTLNYHKHPEVGGMGHVSIDAKYGDEKTHLSVYPTPSPLSILSHVSFYLFPSSAINSNRSPEDSPIIASYKIPSDAMTSPHQALDEVKKIGESVNSGKTGFSITPNSTTATLYGTLRNPHVSNTNISVGFQTFDREKITNEMKNNDVTNCADAVSRVLEAGGIPRPEGLFGSSYVAPSTVDEFCKKSGWVNTASTETQTSTQSSIMAKK